MAERIHSAERVFRVLDVLWDFAAGGLSPSEVARAAQVTPPVATRALRTLERVGYAERLHETGRWRPHPRLGRKITRAQTSFDTAAARHREDRARFGIST